MQTLISALLDVGLMGRLGVGVSTYVWGQSRTPWQEVVFVPELDH